MAKFIEVTPFKDGKSQPKMLINTEKIDYVREESDGLAVIYLKDIPLMPFTKKPVFDNPIYVTSPFILLSDKLMETEEVKE